MRHMRTSIGKDALKGEIAAELVMSTEHGDAMVTDNVEATVDAVEQMQRISSAQQRAQATADPGAANVQVHGDDVAESASAEAAVHLAPASSTQLGPSRSHRSASAAAADADLEAAADEGTLPLPAAAHSKRSERKCESSSGAGRTARSEPDTVQLSGDDGAPAVNGAQLP